MTTKILAIALGTAWLMAGCSPLAPQPDHSKYFILTPVDGAGTPAAAGSPRSAQKLTIGIGPIEFPDYLRRIEVVTLTSPYQVDLSQERRWAEPLNKNFARVLIENLSQMLNTQQIEKYPWSRMTDVDYQITIDLQRFETTSDGTSQLVARWIIKNGRTGKDLYASETKTSTPIGPGDTGVSAALSNDLATLSRDIANHVTELGYPRNRTASRIEG